MGRYSYLSDADLLAKWQQYEQAGDDLALGGGMVSISGEGRRKEFTAANPGMLYANLRELRTEVASRPSLAGQVPSSNNGSLLIEFGRDVGDEGFGMGTRYSE